MELKVNQKVRVLGYGEGIVTNLYVDGSPNEIEVKFNDGNYTRPIPLSLINTTIDEVSKLEVDKFVDILRNRFPKDKYQSKLYLYKIFSKIIDLYVCNGIKVAYDLEIDDYDTELSDEVTDFIDNNEVSTCNLLKSLQCYFDYMENNYYSMEHLIYYDPVNEVLDIEEIDYDY